MPFLRYLLILQLLIQAYFLQMLIYHKILLNYRGMLKLKNCRNVILIMIGLGNSHFIHVDQVLLIFYWVLNWLLAQSHLHILLSMYFRQFLTKIWLKSTIASIDPGCPEILSTNVCIFYLLNTKTEFSDDGQTKYFPFFI